MKTRPAQDTAPSADADGARLLEVVTALVAEVGDGRGGSAPTLDSALDRDLGSEEAITFADLARDARAVAAELRGLGLGPKATVAIMLPTGRGYFAAFLGALLAGAIPVPIYPPVRLDRIAEYMARQSK